MGTAIPGWHVRVLDEQGREALPGTSGGVCLLARSNPNYPLGYWGRPEESHQDFGATWFRTKDIAYADDDGYWYVGRKDDVIKAAGYRVGPHEVEATLRRHPMVLEAAVIGVPDATRGARIVAYVALPDGEAGSDTLADELKSIVREQHSAFAYPKEVHFVRDLPRSSTGKIDRATLRRRYGEVHNA
jgi:acetyl-CoA synthetase